MPLPAPVQWADSEDLSSIPSADDLNLDWRDSFSFLLGVTKPFGSFLSAGGQSITTTAVNVTLGTEKFKRQLTHSTVTNSHLVTVPYDGMYCGYATAGFDTISSTGVRPILRLLQNASTLVARWDQPTPQTSSWTIGGSFTAKLTANDTLNLTMATSTGTATSSNNNQRQPRFMLWYVGDAA